MKRLTSSLITLVLVLAALSTPLFAEGWVERPADAFFVELIAGRHMDAGEVYVWNDEANLYVEFVAGEGWSLGETHVYAGRMLPKKAPGQFPYKEGGSLYVIPLANLGVGSGDTLFVAAHAVVQMGTQGETAWGEGCPFGKSWAMYFPYTVGDYYTFPQG